jgi:RimJ/RimL family protein N-acetyltransferase
LHDTQLIGYGGLVNISWKDKRAEMSFLVSPEIAANANQYSAAISNFIGLIKTLVFDEMMFNRLFTETYEFRDFHIAQLVQNGFVQEGIMRQHIFENNRYCDSILHGMLRRDYDEFKK